jgi:hypothetical protein
MKSTNKPYCDGTLTEAALRSKIINALRKVSMFWKPKSTAIKRALAGQRINPKTSKNKNYYICELTGEKLWLDEIKADHIEPVVPEKWGKSTSFLGYNWNEYIARMFVEAEGYQAISKEAHAEKTKAENKLRKSKKSLESNRLI